MIRSDFPDNIFIILIQITDCMLGPGGNGQLILNIVRYIYSAKSDFSRNVVMNFVPFKCSFWDA